MLRDWEQYLMPSKAYMFKIGFAPSLALFNIKAYDGISIS